MHNKSKLNYRTSHVTPQTKATESDKNFPNNNKTNQKNWNKTNRNETITNNMIKQATHKQQATIKTNSHIVLITIWWNIIKIIIFAIVTVTMLTSRMYGCLKFYTKTKQINNQIAFNSFLIIIITLYCDCDCLNICLCCSREFVIFVAIVTLGLFCNFRSCLIWSS